MASKATIEFVTKQSFLRTISQLLIIAQRNLSNYQSMHPGSNMCIPLLQVYAGQVHNLLSQNCMFFFLFVFVNLLVRDLRKDSKLEIRHELQKMQQIFSGSKVMLLLVLAYFCKDFEYKVGTKVMQGNQIRLFQSQIHL